MKICIVKLGAKGDVIRTLPVLIGIKQKYQDSEITWIVHEKNSQLIKDSPYIDKILYPDSEINEPFDILFNFDIDETATSLAQKIHANKKYGFYLEAGYAAPYNLEAEHYLNTLFDDEIKKSNTKTYQELMFKLAELPYNKEHHPIHLSEQDNQYAQEFINKNQINKENLIGIHLGTSSRWPSKKWHRENLKQFIRLAKEENYEVLLFAGPNELRENQQIALELQEQAIQVYINNPENTDKQFASLVNICNSIICADSFALHVSLALKKPTIALFFCTSPNEVESYNLLIKIISPKLQEFFPEKMDQYDEELVKSITAQEVLEALEEIYTR